MGYKLAGFDVIGCNEIDPRMMKAYISNHAPKYPFLEPIQEFKLRDDLPEELYDLDILDGSPPCSSFSTAGSRDDDWGKKKKFREGQAEQVLDTLFFDFIDLAKKLQPKVVIAENVKGLLIGEAKSYVARIYDEFANAGYYVQHWLLDGSKMGLPQRRERVFFVCMRKDLAAPFMYQANIFEELPLLSLDFDEPEIPFGDIVDYSGKELSDGKTLDRWKRRQRGDKDISDITMREEGVCTGFNDKLIYNESVCPTLRGNATGMILFEQPKFLGRSEVCGISSFPQDYDFVGQSPHYICGMSVPPIMMAQVAHQVYEQWLSKIN